MMRQHCKRACKGGLVNRADAATSTVADAQRLLATGVPQPMHTWPSVALPARHQHCIHRLWRQDLLREL